MPYVRKIEWIDVNLTFRVVDGSFERKILTNLSGEIYAGQLLAIMGPAASGKTSFLNLLSGRNKIHKNLNMSGNVIYDDEPVNTISMNRKVICVMQDDVLSPHLTVKETLTFAACFHMPLSTLKEDKDRKVNSVMEELSLSSVANTVVETLSHGAYKRLLIGKELMKNPTVLFLDEPTTGLDSFAALSMMETMKTVVGQGRIVISVIHQPRSSIFALFDQMLLLSEGRTMYFGPAADALTHFVSLGLVCPFHYNPADFFLDILSVNKKSPELEASTRARVEFIAEQWARHKRQCGTGNSFDYCGDSIDGHGNDEDQTFMQDTWRDSDLTFKGAFARWWVDFGLLSRRMNLQKIRNRAFVYLTVAITVFFAVLLSLVYIEPWKGLRGIHDRTGLLFFVLVNQTFTPFAAGMIAFPFERRMVSREIWGGAYRPSAYYAARVVNEMPLQILLAIVYCTVIYWATQLTPHWDLYLVFVLVITLVTLASLSLGFLVSSVAPTALVAAAIGWPIIIILFLFGGYYINKMSLPIGSRWVTNISFIFWGFQGLAVNELKGKKFNCSPDSAFCVPDGETALRRYSMENASKWTSVVALALFTVACLALGYCGVLVCQEKHHSIPRTPAEPLPAPMNEVRDQESFGGLDMSTCPIDPLQPYQKPHENDESGGGLANMVIFDRVFGDGKGSEDEEKGGVESRQESTTGSHAAPLQESTVNF